ncbi:MAG: reverse transcriptase-like protein [Polyangiaceae bacterium]
MPEWIHTLTVACAGGHRDGATGIGIVVEERGAREGRGPATWHVSEPHETTLGADTESFAILRALEFALEHGYSRIQVRSSANGLRNKLRRDFREEKCTGGPTSARILELALLFSWIDFRWVPRRKNQTARRLAREAWETLSSVDERSRHTLNDEFDELHERHEDHLCESSDETPDSIPF